MMSAGGCLHVCRPAGSAGPPDHLHAGRSSAHAGVIVLRVITPSVVSLVLKLGREMGWTYRSTCRLMEGRGRAG